MKYLVAGIPRTGTVHVWQIMNYLFPGEVEKLHVFNPIKLKTIICYRDWRHGFCSFVCALTGEKFEDTPISFIMDQARVYKRHIIGLNQYREMHPKNLTSALYIKYEDGATLDRIEKFFGEITDKQRKYINENFSIEANKKISDKREAEGLRFIDSHDTDSLIHANHISNQDFVPFRSWVEHFFIEELVYWGYEIRL